MTDEMLHTLLIETAKVALKAHTAFDTDNSQFKSYVADLELLVVQIANDVLDPEEHKQTENSL